MASWRPLGISWARDGRQDRSGSAPGRLLGRSWRSLLASLWAVLALPGGPREAPGGSGEGLQEAMLVLLWMVQRQKQKGDQTNELFQRFRNFVRVLGLMFAFFLLAWYAPDNAANIEQSSNTVYFCGSLGIHAFFTHTTKGNKLKAAACQT